MVFHSLLSERQGGGRAIEVLNDKCYCLIDATVFSVHKRDFTT